eukprot:scaffold3025_cov112-Skeletonema_dohrnii-CCMP3373.AAC.2
MMLREGYTKGFNNDRIRQLRVKDSAAALCASCPPGCRGCTTKNLERNNGRDIYNESMRSPPMRGSKQCGGEFGKGMLRKQQMFSN